MGSEMCIRDRYRYPLLGRRRRTGQVQLVRVLHDDVLDAHAAEQLLGQFGRRRALEQEGHVGDDDRRAPDRQPYGILGDLRRGNVAVRLEVVSTFRTVVQELYFISQ